MRKLIPTIILILILIVSVAGMYEAHEIKNYYLMISQSAILSLVQCFYISMENKNHV